MVRALHEAGIEVILDVVYNHTAEGNHLGPTLSLRGIDNAGLLPAGRGRPAVLHGLHRHRQLAERAQPARPAADHGLAALLGDRDARRRLPLRPGRRAGPRVLRRRPAGRVLRPRPAGPGDQPGQADRRAVGRRPGRLPGRQLPAAVDGVERPVPRHRAGLLARRAGHARRVRLPAHRQLGPLPGRRPPAVASINFVTAHDGFTLADLVSYNDKHNEANGEGNRDGADDNRSWNCGVEGQTDDAAVLELRARQQRNFLATLLRRQGVPMLLHGDELGPHPAGNNNAYCQDNETSWVDWSLATKNAALLDFTAGRGRAAGRAPGVPPPPVLRRPADPPRRRAARHRLVHPGRRGDDRAGLGVRLRQVRHRVPQRRRHHRTSTRAASGSPTTRSCSASTRTTRTSRSTLPAAELRLRAGSSWSTPRPARCRPWRRSRAWSPPSRRRWAPGGPLSVPARSLLILQRTE